MSPLLKRLAIATSTIAMLAAAPQALAFCGFFVAKGDAKLFNEASKVVMVRDANRTVITMVNDFQGDASDFAMVVPAPTVLACEQIHVTENAVVYHLDAYSAPRLVEYFDPYPCQPIVVMERAMALSVASPADALEDGARNKALGVTVEAKYLVGEYEILILSTTQSDGLETWLKENDYSVPDGAAAVLGSYIKQGMKFFVTRLHVRYDQESFPEDLRLVETGDRTNFQGRYILRHAFTGEMSFAAGDEYRQSLPQRYESEAQTLANLTGWDINDIRADMKEYGTDPGKAPDPVPWWEGIWKK